MHLNIITKLILLAGLISAGIAPAESDLQSLPLAQLERHLTAIDAELKQLAHYSLRGDTGSLGYRSQSHRRPDEQEWIQIELGEESSINQVVLAPILYRDAKTELRAESFPAAFRILAGTAHSTNVVATFTEKDQLLPRIAPLSVSFQPVSASWVRIETTTLSPHMWGELYMLQLSEIMVFSGTENVALQKPVTVPYPAKHPNRPRHEQFLTDGFSPYLMNAAQGSRSKTLLMIVNTSSTVPSLTVDLKDPYPVNQINLHMAHVTPSFPMSDFGYRAVPRHVQVAGANRPDFSDRKILCEYEQKTIYDNGPIIMRRFPETVCRYIRMEILDHQPVVSVYKNASDVAFSEIEVLSRGQNIALKAPVTKSLNLSGSDRSLARLTDGLNYYGKIIPLHSWMNQLARRHDLEQERPRVVAELKTRYARQKTRLRRMSWLAALLAAGIVISIHTVRLIHLRQMEKMRNRFAADLHDELGANIHTIGLLSDAANSPQSSAEERNMLHQRIRNLTRQTGTAIRNISNMVNADNLYLGLVEDMQRASLRIMAQFEHTLDIQGEEYLAALKSRTRIDLFLFYKECLINICRHSGASQCRTQLTATPRQVTLVVQDNGKGLPEEIIPASLQRRARMLKGKLSAESPASGGTKITLKLHPRK